MSHMDESCHTYEGDMSHADEYYSDSHMNESCHV